MTKLSISLAITAAAFLTTAACDRDAGEINEEATGAGQVGEPYDQTKQDKKEAQPGMQPGTQEGMQPGTPHGTQEGMQPGTPHGTQEGMQQPGAQQGVQPGTQPGAQQQPGEQQPLPAAMQERMTQMQDRYTKLERQATEVQREIEADGGEARPELDAEIQQAKMLAKAKLEAASKASAETAETILNEVEESLNELEKKLEKYEGKT